MAMRCGNVQGILAMLRSLVRAREAVLVAGESPLIVQEGEDEEDPPSPPYPPELCKYRALCLNDENVPREKVQPQCLVGYDRVIPTHPKATPTMMNNLRVEMFCVGPELLTITHIHNSARDPPAFIV